MSAFLPQLRLRTECSFGKVYGKVEKVVDYLNLTGHTFVAVVEDSGTWSHVRFEKQMKKYPEAIPAFGACFKSPTGTRWSIGNPSALYYSLSKFDEKEPFCGAGGLVTFSGDDLSGPIGIDYVDINPLSVAEAQRRIAFAKENGIPVVLTGFNDYPSPEDFDKFMAFADNERMTPQHILVTRSQWREAFWFLNDADFEKYCANTLSVANGVGKQRHKLAVAPMIDMPGDLWAEVNRGMLYRVDAGHIEKWTDVYQARLEREMAMIAEKGFESYFICVGDLVRWAKTKMLVGPARGSSAGSLVCYLLEITEVDPIPHDLLFERFIDINRADLPDIDIDFNDTKRELVFEYLAQKYGKDNVARIGSINTLKPRSVMAIATKKLGIPVGATFNVLNVLIEYSSGDARFGKGLEDTLQNTQPGRSFVERYPEVQIVLELENHASHTGVHAAGIIVSNRPVIEFCTVKDGIAQIDKKDAEYLNLLKIDALGLRTLGVIEDAGVVTSRQLYDLKLNDPKVFSVFNNQKFSGLFQFEGAAQRQVSIMVPIDDFKKIDHVTALARPGPLGGGAAQHYTNRNMGKERIEYKHPSMAEYLGDTMGVVLYQEQVMRIVREIGNFSWEDTSTIRKAMSGRKGEEFFNKHGEKFIEGAARLGIKGPDALAIWNEICGFGAWGMNKSHTTSYAVISYWCAWMKCYHPLEYAAALLRNAKDAEQTLEMLRELAAEGVEYVPFDPILSDANWSAKDGKIIGGFTNLKGIGPVKAATLIHKRNTVGLSTADMVKLEKLPIEFIDLRPAHTMWKDYYENPEAFNIDGRVKEFADLEDFENAVVLCQLIKKERRDENEQVRVSKRNGKRYAGQSLFLDLHVVDDSVSKPVRLRVKCDKWESIGIPIADNAVDKQDWFLVRGRWLKQFSMMTIQRIKCLTNPELQAMLHGKN